MKQADLKIHTGSVFGRSNHDRELRDSDIADHSNHSRILGIAICSLLPAIFWSAVIWLAAPVAGLHLTISGLAAIGSTMALFLTVIASVVLACT